MSDNEKNLNQNQEVQSQEQEYVEYEIKYEDVPPKMKIIDDKAYGRRDPLAPKKLIVKVFDEKGNELSKHTCKRKKFKTTSVGFYHSGKLEGEAMDCTYQVGLQFTLIDSKLHPDDIKKLK